MLKKLSLFVIFTLLCVNLFAGDGQFPAIYNVTLTLANTEYSQELPAGTKKITVQCRTAYDVRLAFATGYVATPTSPYITIKAGSVYWEDDLSTKIGGQTLYFASSQAGTIVEIICWQ